MNLAQNRLPTPILLVNWKGLSDTIECIESLMRLEDKNIHIHLWDNFSSQKEYESLIAKYGDSKQITVYKSEKNIGFTQANNQMLKNICKYYSPDSYVALVNNDTIVDKNWLCEALKLCANNNAHIVATKMLKFYNRNLIDNLGHFVLSNGEILPMMHNEDKQNVPQIIESVGGCAGGVLYKVGLIKQIGLFDNYFNTGYEDAEFGLRAFLSGKNCLFSSEAKIFHKGGNSIRKIFTLDFSIKEQKNILYTVYKLLPLIHIIVITPVILLRALCIILMSILFWRISIAKVISRAYWEFYTKDIFLALSKRKENDKMKFSYLHLIKCMKSTMIYDLRRFEKYFLFKTRTAVEKY